MEQNRLTRMLIEVGDEGGIKRGMDNIVVTLLKDLAASKTVFLEALIGCVKEIPAKTTIYGCLAGLLNLREPSLVDVVVGATSDALDEAVKEGDFRSIKLLLRFFGELVNAGVITGASYLELLSSVISVIDSANVKPQLIDAIVFCVLAALPWSSFHLNQTDSEGLASMVNIIDAYMTRRRESLHFGSLGLVFDALKVYRDCPKSEPYMQIDKLEHLWTQILNLQASNWDEFLLMRPENALFVELSGGTKHPLRSFILPSNFHLTDIPEQEPIFWAFDDSVNTPEKILVELPSTTKIERFILDDIILDTIHLLSHNHIECSNILLTIDKFHKETTTLNFHQAMVENLIRELIKLPSSQELGVYYATLLFDLCKAAPTRIPSAMGRALRVIFSRLDSSSNAGAGGMDVECVRRLGVWFSHHLSNFNYNWKWADWSYGLEDTSSAKFSFLRESLEREVRLGYYDRIVSTLPDSFTTHDSVFPKEAPSFEFAYATGYTSEDSEFDAIIARLNRQLSSKGDPDSVIPILEDILTHRKNTFGNVMTLSLSDQKPALVWEEDAVVRDVFVQHVLFLGTKSFSHFLNIVERYVKILQQLSNQPEGKLHTVQIISKFWKNNAQNLEIVLDKLMNYRVVDPTSIITWVLDLEVLMDGFSRWHFWTILKNVLTKVNSKVSQLREKIGVNAMEEDDSTVQEQLDLALRDQKAAFILMFQRFQLVLKSLLEQGEIPESSSRWRWISGNLREMGRSFHNEIGRLKFTLEATAFVEQPIEPHILQIWNEIKAVGELLVKS